MEKRIINQKNIMNNAFRRIYDSSIYLILFEVFYKGLILVMFRPILEIIVSLFNKDGSYIFFINEEITRTFLRTTGYLTIMLVMVLAVILLYFELSVILLILYNNRKKEKLDLSQIIKIALAKVKNTIKIKNIGLAFYLLPLIPLFNIGIQSSFYPMFSMPDWLIKKVSKYPGKEIILSLLTLGFIYLFTKLFIVLPIMIFNHKSFKESAKISLKTIKSQGFKIAFLIIIIILIWLILTYPPFMILERVQLVLPLIVRSAPSISINLITLFIPTFLMGVSLENYSSYVESGDLNRGQGYEEISLDHGEKRPRSRLENLFKIIEVAISKLKNHKKSFIFASLIIIIGLSVYSDESARPIYKKQLLIGHRGGDYGVENTLDAILYAGDNGADYVEIDALLTKDSVPVVIHDNSLKRLADTGKKISDLTVEEVKEITIKDGEKEDEIPLLEEVAREVKGKINLLVEFKSHDKEKDSIIDKSIEVLDKEGILEESKFQTAEEDLLEEFKEKYKDLPIGFIYKGRIGLLPIKKLANMPVDFISVKESLINKKMIRKLHKAEKAVFTWTTNKDQKAERILKLGVDGIISDYSVEKVELRDKYDDYN